MLYKFHATRRFGPLKRMLTIF